MRTVVNISLPATMTKEVTREAKRLNFASKSEFFRHVFREWQRSQTVEDVRKSNAEYVAGKAKKLKSLKDLWK